MHIRFSSLEIQSSLEYWTAERMANALPAPLLQIDMPEISQPKNDEFAQVETEMFLSCFPQRKVHRLREGGRVNINKDPYRQAGRLYYKQADGRDKYATAQFVGAANILLTAAHCLRAPYTTGPYDGWSYSMVFSRALQDTTSAQNTSLGIGFVSLPDNWGKGGSQEDLVQINYGFTGTVCRSTAGFLKLSKKTYNQLPYNLKAIGYPENYGGKKKFMYKQYGRRGAILNGAVSMIGNNLGDGATGGAWFNDHGSNSVVGLNVFKDRRGVMWGPVFGPEIQHKLREMKQQYC